MYISETQILVICLLLLACIAVGWLLYDLYKRERDNINYLKSALKRYQEELNEQEGWTDNEKEDLYYKYRSALLNTFNISPDKIK